MITLSETYAPRPIRCLEVWAVAGWRLKVYGLAYQLATPRPAVVAAGKAAAQARLQMVSGLQHYGVGFVGVNDGRGAIFVFVDFWADENELHHHVYVAPKDQPDALVYQTPSGLAACVWDLRVIGFERQAWLDAVLANPAGPDLDRYLALQLNEDV